MDFSLFDISVPKALRDTLVIAFFFFLHHLRYLRDHLLSFFSYLQPHLSHSEDLEDVPI